MSLIHISREKDWFFSFTLGKGWFGIDIPYLSIFVEVNNNGKES